MTQLQAERYRLVTRSDFDGLVCAALLKELGMLDEVTFVHPKDVQDGKVELGPGDITTNLPYHPGVGAAFDKGDAARFSLEEILEPTGWVLLNVLMDPRTGLGRFRDFRISNYQLMMQLIDVCTSMSVEEILAMPDVAERVDLYFEHAERAVEQIKRCATLHGNLVVLDLRDEEVIHP